MQIAMNSKEYLAELRSKLADRRDVEFSSEPLRYAKGEYEFVRIASRPIGPTDKVLLLRAGLHGEEIAGPLSLLEYGREIFDHAAARAVKLIVYPLANPSGFEHGTRYNVDGDRGDAGNGDFLRYELADGTLVDDLKSGNEFKRWFWSSDPVVKAHLPLETRVMQRKFKSEPLDRIAAVVDLHQDFITPDVSAAAYHYAFGDLSAYAPIIKDVASVVPLLRNTPIGAGFYAKLTESGVSVSEVPESEKLISDENGLIVRHDGSLPDLMYRLGTKNCVTVETTGATPLIKAIEVNRIWIRGIIDLIGQK